MSSYQKNPDDPTYRDVCREAIALIRKGYHAHDDRGEHAPWHPDAVSWSLAGAIAASIQTPQGDRVKCSVIGKIKAMTSLHPIDFTGTAEEAIQLLETVHG